MVTLWTVARQAPLSIEFSRPEYGSGVGNSCSLLQGICLTQGWSTDPALPADSLPTEPPEKLQLGLLRRLNEMVHFCSKSAVIIRKESVSQSCPTLCDPMDCSPPGSSAHGISQARILEWVAIPFSRGCTRPRDRTWVSCIAGRFFTI